VQIHSYTEDFNEQAIQNQANVAYANELLTYKLGERANKLARQKEYEEQLRKELARRQATETIKVQNAGNTKDLYDKLVVADLADMQLHMYKGGVPVGSFPILSKGRIGSRWETPAGLYSVATKERNHFSSIGSVNMPYSMQFFGNFFVHGWPTDKKGNDVPTGYSGGCVRLSTKDASQVFDFATIGTKLLIANSQKVSQKTTNISTENTLPKYISADAYLVADVNTGAVYAKKNIDKVRAIASVTKLITALTANAVVRYDAKVPITASYPIGVSDYRQLHKGVKLKAVDTVFPLLMESNNAVAHALAEYYGTSNFLSKMRQQVRAIGMEHTSLADASGISAKNRSTARDLFKLARYIHTNSQFLLNVTRLKSQTIYGGGHKYNITNHNHFSQNPNFVGGKTGYTTAARQTMLSIFKTKVDGEDRTIAIIILGSNKRKKDVQGLYNWFTKHANTDKSHNEIFAEGGTTHITGPSNL
jgi:D-alanyl-D-alanine endopeptidase (penicillin-binding protein 7)